MNIYDSKIARSAQETMHKFLQNSIDITRPIVMSQLGLGDFKLAAFSGDEDTKFVLGFDGDDAGDDVSQVNITHQAYCGFQQLLKKIDVSGDFVERFSAEVGRVLYIMPRIDSGDIQGMTQDLPVDTKIVSAKSSEAKLEAERTTWQQYSSLLSLFSAKDRFFTAQIQQENPDALALEVNVVPIQRFINKNLKRIGPVRDLREGRDYEVLAP